MRNLYIKSGMEDKIVIRVLVTGGTGVLGREVVSRPVEQLTQIRQIN